MPCSPTCEVRRPFEQSTFEPNGTRRSLFSPGGLKWPPEDPALRQQQGLRPAMPDCEAHHQKLHEMQAKIESGTRDATDDSAAQHEKDLLHCVSLGQAILADLRQACSSLDESRQQAAGTSDTPADIAALQQSLAKSEQRAASLAEENRRLGYQLQERSNNEWIAEMNSQRHADIMQREVAIVRREEEVRHLTSLSVRLDGVVQTLHLYDAELHTEKLEMFTAAATAATTTTTTTTTTDTEDLQSAESLLLLPDSLDEIVRLRLENASLQAECDAQAEAIRTLEGEAATASSGEAVQQAERLTHVVESLRLQCDTLGEEARRLSSDNDRLAAELGQAEARCATLQAEADAGAGACSVLEELRLEGVDGAAAQRSPRSPRADQAEAQASVWLMEILTSLADSMGSAASHEVLQRYTVGGATSMTSAVDAAAQVSSILSADVGVAREALVQAAASLHNPGELAVEVPGGLPAVAAAVQQRAASAESCIVMTRSKVAALTMELKRASREAATHSDELAAAKRKAQKAQQETTNVRGEVAMLKLESEKLAAAASDASEQLGKWKSKAKDAGRQRTAAEAALVEDEAELADLRLRAASLTQEVARLEGSNDVLQTTNMKLRSSIDAARSSQALPEGAALQQAAALRSDNAALLCEVEALKLQQAAALHGARPSAAHRDAEAELRIHITVLEQNAAQLRNDNKALARQLHRQQASHRVFADELDISGATAQPPRDDDSSGIEIALDMDDTIGMTRGMGDAAPACNGVFGGGGARLCCAAFFAWLGLVVRRKQGVVQSLRARLHTAAEAGSHTIGVQQLLLSRAENSALHLRDEVVQAGDYRKEVAQLKQEIVQLNDRLHARHTPRLSAKQMPPVADAEWLDAAEVPAPVLQEECLPLRQQGAVLIQPQPSAEPWRCVEMHEEHCDGCDLLQQRLQADAEGHLDTSQLSMQVRTPKRALRYACDSARPSPTPSHRGGERGHHKGVQVGIEAAALQCSIKGVEALQGEVAAVRAQNEQLRGMYAETMAEKEGVESLNALLRANVEVNNVQFAERLNSEEDKAAAEVRTLEDKLGHTLEENISLQRHLKAELHHKSELLDRLSTLCCEKDGLATQLQAAGVELRAARDTVRQQTQAVGSFELLLKEKNRELLALQGGPPDAGSDAEAPEDIEPQAAQATLDRRTLECEMLKAQLSSVLQGYEVLQQKLGVAAATLEAVWQHSAGLAEQWRSGADIGDGVLGFGAEAQHAVEGLLAAMHSMQATAGAPAPASQAVDAGLASLLGDVAQPGQAEADEPGDDPVVHRMNELLDAMRHSVGNAQAAAEGSVPPAGRRQEDQHPVPDAVVLLKESVSRAHIQLHELRERHALDAGCSAAAVRRLLQPAPQLQELVGSEEAARAEIRMIEAQCKHVVHYAWLQEHTAMVRTSHSQEASVGHADKRRGIVTEQAAHREKLVLLESEARLRLGSLHSRWCHQHAAMRLRADIDTLRLKNNTMQLDGAEKETVISNQAKEITKTAALLRRLESQHTTDQECLQKVEEENAQLLEILKEHSEVARESLLTASNEKSAATKRARGYKQAYLLSCVCQSSLLGYIDISAAEGRERVRLLLAHHSVVQAEGMLGVETAARNTLACHAASERTTMVADHHTASTACLQAELSALAAQHRGTTADLTATQGMLSETQESLAEQVAHLSSRCRAHEEAEAGLQAMVREKETHQQHLAAELLNARLMLDESQRQAEGIRHELHALEGELKDQVMEAESQLLNASQDCCSVARALPTPTTTSSTATTTPATGCAESAALIAASPESSLALDCCGSDDDSAADTPASTVAVDESRSPSIPPLHSAKTPSPGMTSATGNSTSTSSSGDLASAKTHVSAIADAMKRLTLQQAQLSESASSRCAQLRADHAAESCRLQETCVVLQQRLEEATLESEGAAARSAALEGRLADSEAESRCLLAASLQLKESEVRAHLHSAHLAGVAACCQALLQELHPVAVRWSSALRTNALCDEEAGARQQVEESRALSVAALSSVFQSTLLTLRSSEDRAASLVAAEAEHRAALAAESFDKLVSLSAAALGDATSLSTWMLLCDTEKAARFNLELQHEKDRSEGILTWANGVSSECHHAQGVADMAKAELFALESRAGSAESQTEQLREALMRMRNHHEFALSNVEMQREELVERCALLHDIAEAREKETHAEAERAAVCRLEVLCQTWVAEARDTEATHLAAVYDLMHAESRHVLAVSALLTAHTTGRLALHSEEHAAWRDMLQGAVAASSHSSAALVESNDKLRRIASDLRCQVEEAERDGLHAVAALSGQVNDATSYIRALEEEKAGQVRELTSQINVLTVQVGCTRQEREQFSAKCAETHSAKRDNETLRGEVLLLRSQCARMELRVKETTSHSAELATSLEKKACALQEATRNLAALSTQHTELSRKHGEACRVHQAHQGELEHTARALCASQQKGARFEEECGAMAGELDALRESHQRLEAVSQEGAAHVSQLRAESTALQQQLRCAEQAQKEGEARLTQQLLATAERENAHLQIAEEVAALREGLQEAQDTQRVALAAQEEAEARCERADEELVSVSAALGEAQPKLDAASSELAELQVVHGKTEAHCRALEKQHEAADSELRDTHHALAAAQADLLRSEEERVTLKDSLATTGASLEGSTSQVVALKADLTQSRDRLRAAEAEVHELRSEIDKAADAAHANTREFAAKERVVADLQAESGALRQELGSAAEALATLQGAHAAASSDLQAEIKTSEKLRFDLDETTTELRQAQAGNSDMQARLGEHEKLFSELQASSQALRASLQESESLVEALKDQAEQHELTVVEKDAALCSAEARLQQGAADLQQAKRALREQNEMAKLLQAEIDTLIAEQHDAVSDTEARTQEAAKLQASNDALQRDNSGLEEEVDLLAKRLACAQQDVAVLQTQRDGLSAEITESRNRCAALEEGQCAEQARVEELCQRVAHLEADNAALCEKGDTLDLAVRTHTAAEAALGAELQALQADASQSRGDAERLACELEAAQGALAEADALREEQCQLLAGMDQQAEECHTLRAQLADALVVQQKAQHTVHEQEAAHEEKLSQLTSEVVQLKVQHLAVSDELQDTLARHTTSDADVAAARKEVCQLQEELDQLQGAHATATAALSEATTNTESLSAQLHASAQRAADLETQLHDATQRADTASSSATTLQQQREELQETHTALQTALDTTRHTLRERLEELQDAQDEALSLRQRVARAEERSVAQEVELGARVQELETELQCTTDDLLLTREQKAKVAEQHEQAEMERMESQEAVRITIAAHESVALQRDTASSEAEGLRQKVARLESHRDELQHAHRTVEGDLQAALQERDTLRDTLTELAASLEAVEQQLQDLRVEYAELKQEARQDRDSVQALEGDAASSASLVNTLREEVGTLSADLFCRTEELAQLRSSAADVQALQDRLGAAEAEMAQQQQTLAALRETIATKDEEAAALRRAADDSSSTLHHAEERASALQQELSTAQASLLSKGTEVAELTRELTRACDTVASKENARNAVEHRCDALVQENKRLAEKVEQLDDRLAEAEARRMSAASETTTSVGSLQQQVAAARTELLRKEDEAAVLRKQVDAAELRATAADDAVRAERQRCEAAEAEQAALTAAAEQSASLQAAQQQQLADAVHSAEQGRRELEGHLLDNRAEISCLKAELSAAAEDRQDLAAQGEVDLAEARAARTAAEQQLAQAQEAAAEALTQKEALSLQLSHTEARLRNTAAQQEAAAMRIADAESRSAQLQAEQAESNTWMDRQVEHFQMQVGELNAEVVCQRHEAAALRQQCTVAQGIEERASSRGDLLEAGLRESTHSHRLLALVAQESTERAHLLHHCGLAFRSDLMQAHSSAAGMLCPLGDALNGQRRLTEELSQELSTLRSENVALRASSGELEAKLRVALHAAESSRDTLGTQVGQLDKTRRDMARRLRAAEGDAQGMREALTACTAEALSTAFTLTEAHQRLECEVEAGTAFVALLRRARIHAPTGGGGAAHAALLMQREEQISQLEEEKARSDEAFRAQLATLTDTLQRVDASRQREIEELKLKGQRRSGEVAQGAEGHRYRQLLEVLTCEIGSSLSGIVDTQTLESFGSPTLCLDEWRLTLGQIRPRLERVIAVARAAEASSAELADIGLEANTRTKEMCSRLAEVGKENTRTAHRMHEIELQYRGTVLELHALQASKMQVISQMNELRATIKAKDRQRSSDSERSTTATREVETLRRELAAATRRCKEMDLAKAEAEARCDSAQEACRRMHDLEQTASTLLAKNREVAIALDHSQSNERRLKSCVSSLHSKVSHLQEKYDRLFHEVGGKDTHARDMLRGVKVQLEKEIARQRGEIAELQESIKQGSP